MAYGGYVLGRRAIQGLLAVGLLMASAVLGFWFPSPWISPIVIILAGMITALNYRQLEAMPKEPMQIRWANFILWGGVFAGAALLGALTRYRPLLLFENFYRNGSLVFGGGQVLAPMLYNEFVAFKHYLTAAEFLPGLAVSQVIPGPNFSISAYVGVLAMRHDRPLGQLLGAAFAVTGIFLPGTFLIFFVYRFWNQLKKYRGIRASLEGINAASIGLTVAATLRLLLALWPNAWAIGIAAATFAMLIFTRIPSYAIVLLGLLAGLWFR